jgi:hypothetical protein
MAETSKRELFLGIVKNTINTCVVSQRPTVKSLYGLFVERLQEAGIVLDQNGDFVDKQGRISISIMTVEEGSRNSPKEPQLYDRIKRVIPLAEAIGFNPDLKQAKTALTLCFVFEVDRLN